MLTDAMVSVADAFAVEIDVNDGYVYDTLVIRGNTIQSTNDIPTMLYANETFTWQTDVGVTDLGWKICFSEMPSN